ncbi:MAG: type IX secretion system membrane protein PorP/SprF [Sphingobacteriales bacterium JAD_PAG50586_3]|nr:MAG: type IX secretion system membrane protein PorP/SprF [Sphingobacteriales bacterium JAD_PAG50586_3]
MKKLFTIAALAFTISLSAQQDPQFTQFFFNKLWVNPGAAGANDAICANLLGRNQWMGFDGHPRTMAFSADMPINSINSGVGLSFYQDKLGQISSTNVKLAYAYRLKLGSGRLGLGVDLGYLGKGFADIGEFSPLQGNDPIVDQLAGSNAGTFDMSFGAFYSNEKLYFGVSATHLTGQNFKFDDNTSVAPAQFGAAQHLWVMGGYNWEISPDFTLKPAFIVKSDLASTQVDINATAVFMNRFWGGLSYRLQDALAVNVGLNIWKDLKLGLAYDITTSKLNQYSSGSAELFLGYCFKIEKPTVKTKFFNTRNLSDR